MGAAVASLACCSSSKTQLVRWTMRRQVLVVRAGSLARARQVRREVHRLRSLNATGVIQFGLFTFLSNIHNVARARFRVLRYLVVKGDDASGCFAGLQRRANAAGAAEGSCLGRLAFARGFDEVGAERNLVVRSSNGRLLHVFLVLSIQIFWLLVFLTIHNCWAILVKVNWTTVLLINNNFKI